MKYASEKKPEEAALIVSALKELYPDAICSLEHGGDPFRLLCMGLLSAQCTDKRVNQVAPALFAAYPDPFAMADAPLPHLEELIRSCGLYKTKARHLKELSAILASTGGAIPRDMDDLVALPGVGRKIANLIRGDLFGLPAIVTDTHCIRICGRLGFYPASLKDPVRVERILVPVIPPAESADFCHRLVLFGRDVCTARAPRCEECPLRAMCREGSTASDGPFS